MRTYLDHNATTPMRVEARAAMLAAFEFTGAASSIHGDGRAARKLVEAARRQLANFVGAQAKNVVFCASATEANNMALTPNWRRGGQDPVQRIAVSAVEHASVSNGVRFPGVMADVLPVDRDGIVLLDGVKALLARWQAKGASGLVSVMLANNETGTIQPVAQIAELVHAAGSLVHCDAAQAAGKIAFSINEIGVDLLTLSSHKLAGPLGAGALVLATDALHNPEPLIRGGGQERGLRAGTENVPAIAGFGAAADAAAHDLHTFAARSLLNREKLEAQLREVSPDLRIFGAGTARLPNTTCFAEPGLEAETALIALDLEGISASSGSACSSGKVKISHVLTAMGVGPELASCAIRVSQGRETTPDDIEFFLTVWKRLRHDLHNRKRHRAA